MKVFDKYVSAAISPLRAIEWAIATMTLVGGLYIFSPLYETSKALHGPSAFVSALSHPYIILFFGAVLVVSSVLVMVGLKTNKPQFKSAGWFAIILCRFFQILTTWIAVGLLPLLWIYPFTLTLVIIILWGCSRAEVRSHANS
jgi:hypothetical protein